MQFKKIIITAVIIALGAIAVRAQEAGASLDTMNFYKRVILELEQRGYPLTVALQNPEFIRQLELVGYQKDSLEYYYNLSKASDEKFNGERTDYMSLLTKSYGDSIVLRWAPSTVDLWQKFNKTGYMIYRTAYLLDAKGQIISNDTTSLVVLADSLHAVKPWALADIEKRIQPSDSAAMVAAQALYGETFNGDATVDKLDFVERNRVREMRFGFSMLMADRSVKAADLLGVRFADKNVRPNAVYNYFVVPVNSERDINMTGFAIQRNSVDANAKVTGLVATPTDKKIKLTWPKNKNPFSEYWIERSEDKGKTWKKLTSDVIVFMENENPGPQTHLDDMLISVEENPAEEANNYCIFTDSTANDISYSYRVSGQTPFGDFSAYAYVDAVSSDQTPPPIPQVTKHEVDENTNIASLEWTMDYDPELIADLAGFTVWEASDPDSTYRQVSPLLPPGTRKFQSPQPLEKEQIHYYVLKAFDKKGNQTATFPMYMHVIDDIPPAPPVNPSYTIDSTGIVTLVWEHNKERDFLGYRIYFTNDLNDELTQLTPEPITVNMYRDTVKIVTLTERIYYRIQAVDRSHNRSGYSAIIEVQKPDVIPPVAPMLHYPEMSDSMIVLHWKPSPSTDVEKHVLYRRLYQVDSTWSTLAVLGPRDTIFRDDSAIEEQLYEYSVQAVDDAGLLSEYAFPVKGRRWFGGNINTVQNLQAVYDDAAQSVRLTWTFEPPASGLLKGVDYVYSIYRSTGTAPLLRYRTLDSKITFFSDTKLKENETVNYAIMVVFNNGKTSALSGQQSVLVKK